LINGIKIPNMGPVDLKQIQLRRENLRNAANAPPIEKRLLAITKNANIKTSETLRKVSAAD
jgi:hypothetical protein